MANSTFTRIALMGRQRGDGITDTLLGLKNYLRSKHYDVVFEKETALMANRAKPAVATEQLSQFADLVIVVGGDGSLLKAARVAVNQDLPVLGINRGRLGFLTDIRPEEFSKIGHVLEGNYLEEERFLLTAHLQHENQTITTEDALNDVVLLPGDVAHMIEFSIYINRQFVCNQRADGLIIATPTGSTAYALSGGGPIMHPNLNAIVLVPMFPHILSSRPIVVSDTSEIEIVLSEDNQVSPRITCDGQERIPVPPGGRIKITQKPKRLRLIHPKDYRYYETLRTKLGWVSQ